MLTAIPTEAPPYCGPSIVTASPHSAARWLLDHRADPDLKHDFGGSGHGGGAVAMHLAAQYRAINCLRLLLARGADPQVTDDLHNSTPMGWARFGESQDSINVLQEFGFPEDTF